MGSNEEIVQLLQKTQTIFKQTQRDKEEKYLNDIIQLQDKIKDLENVVCKMGRSTDTLRLLTNEQKAFRDNLRKSGVGYNGSCVLSQAYAKIPKLYRALNFVIKMINCRVYFDDFQNAIFNMDIKEMKDAFEQNDVYLDEIENQNDLLKDQLLKASLTEDIKNLVITSCVEIRNKDFMMKLKDSKKSKKDVSNDE
ncbi:hypothetical protein Tco_0795291 [Tanacetum coccineum]